MTLLALTATSAAGPWGHPASEGYAKVGYTRFASDEGFLAGEPTGLDFRSHSLETYGELGLPADFTVVGSLPLVHAVNVSDAGTRYTHTWTGDLRLTLQRRLVQKAPVSLGLEARVPTYREPDAYARVRGLDDVYLEAIAAQFPQLGDRNVDLTALLSAGASNNVGWLSAEAGPRLRLGGFLNGAHGAINAGAWIRPQRLGVSLFSSGNLNFPEATGDDTDAATDSEVLPSRQLLSARATVFVALPGTEATLVEIWGGGVLLAEHASTGFDLGVGVSRRFDLQER